MCCEDARLDMSVATGVLTRVHGGSYALLRSQAAKLALKALALRMACIACRRADWDECSPRFSMSSVVQDTGTTHAATAPHRKLEAAENGKDHSPASPGSFCKTAASS